MSEDRCWCPRCGEFVSAGAGGQRVYCSDACRQAMYRHRRLRKLGPSRHRALAGKAELLELLGARKRHLEPPGDGDADASEDR